MTALSGMATLAAEEGPLAWTIPAEAHEGTAGYRGEDEHGEEGAQIFEGSRVAANLTLALVVLHLLAGTVLKIHVLPGERPGEDGILNLADLDRMMAEVEVYETEIGAVEPRQPVEIVADALPRWRASGSRSAARRSSRAIQRPAPMRAWST